MKKVEYYVGVLMNWFLILLVSVFLIGLLETATKMSGDFEKNGSATMAFLSCLGMSIDCIIAIGCLLWIAYKRPPCGEWLKNIN
jgi:hypothetical protein